MKDKAFLFFREFQWNTPDRAEHPKEGRVYLAASSGNEWITPLGDGTALALEKDNMAGEWEYWDCEVEEVTFDNLLELPIKADDIKMMANTEDIHSPTVENVPNNPTIVEDMGNSLYMLREQDPDAYEALVKITTKISDELIGTGYISLTDDLSWNPATAKIANVTAASLQIESYLNETDPKRIGDLLEAIYTLTVETIRKHKILKSTL